MADGIQANPPRKPAMQGQARTGAMNRQNVKYDDGFDIPFEAPGDRSPTNPNIHKAVFRYIDNGDPVQQYWI